MRLGLGLSQSALRSIYVATSTHKQMCHNFTVQTTSAEVHSHNLLSQKREGGGKRVLGGTACKMIVFLPLIALLSYI